MTHEVRIIRCVTLALFSSLILASPSSAQTASPSASQVISKETLEQLSKELKQLEIQIAKSNSFVDEKATELNNQRDIVKTAPEATDKMISDLEALINKFKAGSELAKTVQAAMEQIKVDIDKYREGSDIQKQVTKSLQESLETFKKNDAERDAIVGRGMAAVRMLRSRREDLIALRKAGAYQVMAKIYGEMISSARDTVDGADGVVKSFQKLSPVGVQ